MADNFSLSCELQSFVRDQQKRISKASSLDDIHGSLSCLSYVVNDGVLPSVELSTSEKRFLKAEFAKKHFVRCAELLLCEPSASFLPSLDSIHREKLENFFKEGPSAEAFLVLVGALSQLSKLESVSVIASLLENFIVSEKLVDLFVKNCHKYSENACNSNLKFNENQTITFLVSLPERVANKLRLKSKSLFYPEAYFTELARQIQKALEVIHSVISSNSNDVTLPFLSNLIGRVSMSGHGKTVLIFLLPHFENWSSTSPLWSCLCHKLLTGVPDQDLEPVLENILKEANNTQIISKLFGDNILTSSRLKFLMTTKFLLLRYYSDLKMLRNIIGYLAGCKRRHLLIETLGRLFDSWSNGSSIQHTPYNQHLYISCAIVHIIGYLKSDEKVTHKNEMLKKLLLGVQNHLENPDHKVRRLGMIIAECVTSALEPDAEKLSFEYAEDDESRLIKDLLKGPKSELMKTSLVHKQKPASSAQEKAFQQNGTNESEKANGNLNDDDDDDDLKPYDLDEDDFEGGKPLRHLRDCMEALIESKDTEKFESALKSLEKIVLSNPSDLNEVCIELVKILLHLQDQFSTEDFVTLRHRSMVAITTRCPVLVATYLTEEFYGANYSIVQRLDILDVLTASAKELAKPVELSTEKATSKRFLSSATNSHDNVEGIPEWQKIVQERIDKKTRRFAKGPSKEQPKPVANKFCNIAGYFFYPLMKNFDNKLNTLDLLGDDSYVLGRLIYTLGIIIHCAAGAPGVHNMGVALIEFSWALRYHRESLVRQMLVFALVMVFTSVPIVLLLNDSKEGVFEIHRWLKDLVEKDDDIEMKRTAVQALIVLEEAFKKEVNMNDAKD